MYACNKWQKRKHIFIKQMVLTKPVAYQQGPTPTLPLLLTDLKRYNYEIACTRKLGFRGTG